MVIQVSEVWREGISVGEETGEENGLAHRYREDSSRVWRGGDFWALPMERLVVRHSGNASMDSEVRVVSYKP